MIRKKSAAEIATLREGGRRLAAILREVARAVRPGASTASLNKLAERLARESGDEASFLGYQPAGARRPFPAGLCISINDEVVHGLPGERLLAEADVVGLDFGLKHRGLFTDAAVTVAVGKISPEAQRLLLATKEALRRGIAAARAGTHLSDISAAVEQVAEKYGYGLVRDLGGHGVGHRVHEEPQIPNFGPPGRGPILEPGWVLAIEPMFNLGGGAVKFLPDGYTVKTADGSISAHFEHTIAVTEKGPQILTL